MTGPRALQRSMRVFGVLMLTLSAVTPATAVFVGLPDVVQKAGTGAFLTLLIGAVPVLPMAYVYAELSSAFPIAGGEYALTGRTLGPAAGFAILGLSVLVNMLSLPVLALGVAPYLSSLVPGLNATATAVAVIVVTTVMGVLHVRTNAWITGAFLGLELAALAALALLGFSHVVRPITELALHPVRLNHGALAPAPLGLIGLTSAIAVYAYNGFGGAVYFAEEMHEAPRSVARAILLAALIAIVTVLTPVVAVLMSAPDLKALIGSASPFGHFVRTRGGDWLETAVGLAVALAIFNATLVTVLQNGRFFFSTGRDQAWHPWINELFSLTHSRFHSPWAATLAAGATGVAACFLGLNMVLLLSGASISITYAVLCLALLLGRWRGSSAHAAHKAPLHPLMPIVGLIGAAFVLWGEWSDPQSGRVSVIASLAVMAASLVYYALVLRPRGGWAIRDPAEI